MAKTQQKTSPSITATERIILAVCAGVIALTFILLGLFYTFSVGFLLILVIDLILLMGGKVSETVKRLILLASIAAGLFAVFFIVSAYYPHLI